jgi:hypothetical protein
MTPTLGILLTNNPTGQLPILDNERADDETTRQRLQTRRRQCLTILFAVVVAVIASNVSAQSPNAGIQYDTTTLLPSPHPSAMVNPGRVAGGAIPMPRDKDAEPAYVELMARLANFDADADPDGWRAEIVIRDRLDRPLVLRSRATLTLMPRESTINDNQYLNALPTPVRWSVPLEFDSEARARVKLPLRRSLRPMWGWSPTGLTQPGAWIRRPPSRRRQISPDGRRRSFFITELRPAVGVPPIGQLNVRVAIPTHGVFAATTPVQIRPPALVDTTWPYR